MTPGIEAIYRSESRRVLATLIRLPGDFDQAQEAPHEPAPWRASLLASGRAAAPKSLGALRSGPKKPGSAAQRP